jgi:hypothetical protein
MRTKRWMMSTALILCCAATAAAEKSPFAGRWNISGQPPHENHVYWLEVKEEDGRVAGRFLNRGGSPLSLQEIAVENGELVFRVPVRTGQGPEHRARVEGGKLIGTATLADGTTVRWVGVRPPEWGAYDANARHTFGQPVSLFDGRSIDAWTVQHEDRPSGWSVEDGLMTNQAKANNLVSKQQFKDFRLEAEYKVAEQSNSGIYLRGRYELQILDDHGKPAEEHGHMSIYARLAPDVNASRPAGEWQTVAATILGNRLTVVHNGQKVHDNVAIEGITGGALDAREDEPGPIMLQGDHGKVWFRKIVVTPIVKPGTGS